MAVRAKYSHRPIGSARIARGVSQGSAAGHFASSCAPVRDGSGMGHAQPEAMQTTTDAKLRLYIRRTQLLSRYHDELRHTEELTPGGPGDVADHADDDWSARVLSTLSESDLYELDEVTAALHRIEIGTYGTCSACGDSIEEKRLETLPAAALCRDCASLSEQARPRWTMSVESD